MASAGTVTLDLDANSVKLIRELQKAQTQTKKSTTSMADDAKKAFASMKDNALTATKYIAGIATAAAAAGAAIFKSQSQALDSLAKTADLLGIQQERLQALQVAANLNGVSDLNKQMTNLQRNLGNAARNGGRLADTFKDVGVPVQELLQMAPDKQLEALAKALADVEDRTVRTSIATELFGKEGRSMLKLLEQMSAEGLDPTVKLLEDMGFALSRIDTAKVERANDELEIAGLAFKGLQQQFTVGVSTAVASVASMFTETVKGSNNIADSVEEFMNTLIIGAINLSATLGRFLEPIKNGIADIWQSFTALPAWAKEIGIVGAILLGPKGLIAVGLMSKAIDDWKVTAQWWEAYKNGNIGFSEWFTAGNDQARERLKQLQEDAGKTVAQFRRRPADEGLEGWAPANIKLPEVEAAGETEFSIIDFLFGSDGKQKNDWDAWAENMRNSYMMTFNRIKADVQSVNGEEGTISDFVVGETDPALARLNSMLQSIANSTKTQIEQLQERIDMVKDAINQGITQPFIEAGTTGEEVLRRLEEQMEGLKNKTEQTGGAMEEFGRQAARNLQSSFAQFLFDPFQDGLKGMLRGFIDMIRKMVAEVMAAQILQAMFGGLAGSANPVVAAFGGGFGGVRDVGGRGEAGKAYVINPKAGPELFVPDSAGQFIPNIDEAAGSGMNLSLVIDAKDAGAESRIRDMINREMLPQIIMAAKNETINSIRRPRFA